jgi:hypothetical protein
MKIKITESNLPLIEGYLSSFNGRAVTHTAKAASLLNEVKWAEKRLTELGLNKKQRAKAQLNGRSGGQLPASYKYTRVVNGYSLIRGNRDWFLTSLTKRDAWEKRGWTTVVLTPKQDEIVVSKLRESYWVDKLATQVTSINEGNTPLNPS